MIEIDTNSTNLQVSLVCTSLQFLGPSPTELMADTQQAYIVYGCKSVKVISRLELSLVNCDWEYRKARFEQVTLYWRMIPDLCSGGGADQEIVTDVAL